MFLRSFALILAVLFSSSFFVLGATIQGSAYDQSLTLLNNTVIMLNTTPEQRVVSVDGIYSFDVPKGKYFLKAMYTDGSRTLNTEKNIVISAEGEYTFDLILIPGQAPVPADQLNITLKTNETAVPEPQQGSSFFLWILILLCLLAVGGYLWYRFRWRLRSQEPIIKSEQELELEDLVKFMKLQGGRVYQKDVKKAFPQWSEAKVSLMLSQLEAQGRLKKIKKGRANILLLQS